MAFTIPICGSPPQAWGKSRRPDNFHVGLRFTPTGVGKIEISVPRFAHICGSPPQAWGKCAHLVAKWRRFLVHPHRRGENAEDVRLNMKNLRFTPTGVGKIVSLGAIADALTVHPHRRGENHSPITPAISENGSPPQAWGKCCKDGYDEEYDRFTPTGVGKI